MRKHWRRSEIALVMQLRDEKNLPWKEIAKIVGRSWKSCNARYQDETRTPEQRERERIMHREDQRKRRGTEKPRCCADEVCPAWDNVKSRVLMLRELPSRDLTGEIFGDPPVGRSALDIKQGTYVG